jgi:hypothetical protein
MYMYFRGGYRSFHNGGRYMNKVYMVVGPLKYTKESFTLGDSHPSLLLMMLSNDTPKVHEGLTHLFTETDNCTQSTTESVVPYSTIDDRPHCTTMYMYLTEHFQFRPIFFLPCL